MKKIKNFEIKNNFFSKKKLTIAGIIGLVSSVAIIPPIVTLAVNNIEKYKIGLSTFSSINDAVKYVKENSKTVSECWELHIDGRKRTFSNSNDLRTTIYDEYIKTKVLKTNLDLNSKTNEFGEVQFDMVLGNIYDAASRAAMVYQGYGDVGYDTEEEAYNSYFITNSGYYFNGVFFNSKDDLKKYLIEVFLPNSNLNPNKVNTITLHGPNGISSPPINLDNPNALKQISSFISNNSKTILTYTNSETNDSIAITEENIDNVINKINLKDLDYLHIQSNNGNSKYVVDNDINDENDLIGPYFYEGNLDVGAFMNKDMWKKVNNINKQVFLESKIDSLIGSFFTSIINDDSALILSEATVNKTPPVLFRTLVMDNNAVYIDELFLNNLKNISPQLYEAVIEANLSLLKGKKYNTFFKISILYNFLIQRIYTWNLGQNVLNLVNDYFIEVCNFIQDVIEFIIVDKELLWNKDHTKQFDMVDFFEIGNPEYDTNTGSTYFLDKLKNQFPAFIAAMGSYISAQNNITTLAGLIPFESIDFNYLIDFKILSSTELDSIKPYLKNIYEIFSLVNLSDMINKYISLSKDPSIVKIQSLHQEQWATEFDKLTTSRTSVPLSVILSAVGAKNSTYYNLARATLDTEIELYLNTSTFPKYGYLQKLYSSNKLLDKLSLFIEFVAKNPEVDSFRAYMAFMIDKRMSLGILNYSNISNPYEFGKAITRIIYLALGSIGLVGESISSIYHSGSYNVSGKRFSNRSIYNDSDISNTGTDLTGLKMPNNMPMFELTEENKSSLEQKTLIEEVNNKARVNGLQKGHVKYKVILFEEMIKSSKFVNAKVEVNGVKLGDNKKVVFGSTADAFVKDKVDFWNLPMEERIKLLDQRISGRVIQDSSTSAQYVLQQKIHDKVKGYDYRTRENKAAFLEDLKHSLINRGANPEDLYHSNENRFSSYSVDTWSDLSDYDPTNPHLEVDQPTQKPNMDKNYPGVGETQKSKDAKQRWWESLKVKTLNTSLEDDVSIDDGNKPNWFKSCADDFKRRTAESWSSFKNRFDFSGLKTIGSTIGKYSLEILGTFAAGLEIFFLVYELLRIDYIQDYYVFTAIDGTEWIWNGGLTTSKYFGFEVKQVNGIDKMNLVKPIQITLPQISECYYFNQEKFFDLNDLKRKQISYMLNGGTISNFGAFSLKYSMFNDHSYIPKSNSVNELISDALSSMGIKANLTNNTIDYSNLNLNSEYILQYGTSIDSIIVSSSVNDYVSIANNISDNIRPANFAVLPDTLNGESIGTISNKFSFPGDYWDGRKVISQDPTLFDYIIIDNTANDFKTNVIKKPGEYLKPEDFKIENPQEANNQSLNNLYTSFKTYFKIPNKLVLSNELIKSKFSQMQNGDIETQIYEVNINNVTKHFASQEQARNYLLSTLDIRKYLISDSDNLFYYYNDQIFKNEKEIESWLKKECRY